MIKFLVIFFIFTTVSYATNNDTEAVNCIVGEASGEGYTGMLYVALSIRNRGNLDGVYGCHAKHIKRETEDTLDLATIAWAKSGMDWIYWPANSWGTKEDIKKNHMDSKCSNYIHWKRHTFFKC